MRSDRFPFFIASLLGTLAVGIGSAASAQQPEPVAASVVSSAPGANEFAPGVLTVIPPAVDREDAISIHDIPEIRANESLKWDPSSTTKSRTLFEMGKDAVFVNDVWCLEIAFKPLRMIEVDIPQASGRAQRKLIWYMVYRVRNTGAGIVGSVKPDGTFETAEKGIEPVRFIPEFVLSSHDRSVGERVRKAYLDRLAPTALEPIRRRELPRGELFHSVSMALNELKIEAGRAERGVWGVAMWEDIDPQIDFFSIYVRGLSNAYQWNDPAGAYKVNDPPGAGRKFSYKTLQLNFWRPGDDIAQDEREFRFGTAPGRGAFYDSPEGVAYRWVYR